MAVLLGRNAHFEFGEWMTLSEPPFRPRAARPVRRRSDINLATAAKAVTRPAPHKVGN
jgi:hypothetical protein